MKGEGVGGCMSLYNSPIWKKIKWIKTSPIIENGFMNFIFPYIEKLK